jgi:hypothetical protein
MHHARNATANNATKFQIPLRSDREEFSAILKRLSCDGVNRDGFIGRRAMRPR